MIHFSGNCQPVFNARVSTGNYTCRISAGTLYRLSIDGETVASGPARAPHGYCRVDELTLNLKHDSILTLEVAHYEDKGLYMPQTQGFLSIQLRDGEGKIVLETKDFTVCWKGHRNFAVEKFTSQRNRLESYDYTRLFDYTDLPGEIPETELKFLERGAPLPDLKRIYHALRMEEEARFPLFDFGRVVSGFFRCTLTARTECELTIGIDEFSDGDFPGKRAWWGCYQIRLKLQAGQRIDFESFEVYALRYAGFRRESGEFTVESVSLREYVFPEKAMQVPPAVMNSKIGCAAVETFRQSTVDTFMDCPGRERAAWLCDSFFSARTSFLLTGNTAMEETFIENFLLPDSYVNVPHGMFPMCYPADTKNFIPQWGMWFILELDEYLRERHGRRNFIREFQPRFKAFIDFFIPYFNADGLLENLPCWNFVDCSRANEFVMGVNFPSNLLYSRVLEIMSEWYDLPELAKQSDKLRATVLRHGVSNERLYDNDSRFLSGETAQYYALLFGGERFQRIDFDQAAETGAPCGLLMGKFLRFELLWKMKRFPQLRSELEQIFCPMAEKTGTLWEKMTIDSSFCHGFSSSVVYFIDKLAKENVFLK